MNTTPEEMEKLQEEREYWEVLCNLLPDFGPLIGWNARHSATFVIKLEGKGRYDTVWVTGTFRNTIVQAVEDAKKQRMTKDWVELAQFVVAEKYRVDEQFRSARDTVEGDIIATGACAKSDLLDDIIRKAPLLRQAVDALLQSTGE